MSQDLRLYLSPVWTRYTEILAERGEGVYIYAADGRRYLDFTSGIGVTNTGHCHPRVVAAAQEQAGKLIHGQANIVYHQPMLELVGELLTIVPQGLEAFFFSNSGAEAVEAAVKLARHATGRPNVIVFQGSFHGRTVGTMSLTTSNTIYRVGYQPLMPGVFVAPYPYAYHYGWTPEETSAFCLRELRYLLVTQTAPQETAAVLIEPVLGEGGYVPPPPDFLQGVQQICREHGLLFMVDEVQSGFGRTGRWFGHQHYGVTPDVMIMAKGLASGFPLSGIAAKPQLMEAWITGSHGGTYGGNAVSCAAAAATIRVIREEKLVENSAHMGEYLLARLKVLQEKYPVIGEVRGLGLMVACEFTSTDGQPDTKTAKAVRAKCLEMGLMLLTCGPYANVIRWIPPLIVNQAQISEALQIFELSLAEVMAQD
ncbi:MAG: aminotransferase class III-fold pyridoxal phosphate-dependent enzyme [Anaerolineae bacterium]|jgi:4-aminobutyrate aminotransferase|nr:aminotransferase class III-fold pyridoxal phosphate-dependent enzyme [Anaerolineae bacterium]MDH7473895.1 aminotransferase class III-fold pyridoxal phosphate-dependent enzyme [Anaerolineae bacterium]